MTKTEKKQAAQNEIMHARGTVFYALHDDNTLSDDEKAQKADEIRKQVNRVEKLFGFEENSWKF